MAIVSFKPEEFRDIFHEFQDQKTFTQARLSSAFSSATAILENTEHSNVPYDPDKDIEIRKNLLYFLTAHILILMEQSKNGQHAPISSTSQGSVQASFAAAAQTDKNYFMQTAHGQTYWQMLKPYRLGLRYHVSKKHHPWG